ncbi:class C beta-lactamase [Paraburkholderia sp. BCC1886]|uniref:class C beta-lactamase n=1 Tax=Paraburkholderia sp. BCC1886 TaxID=2562670 RepID=UPI001183A27E|nr:class C beta-lactamase [Paraburkholderia sp. BCC1886]
MKFQAFSLSAAIVCALSAVSPIGHAASREPAIRSTVDAAIRPMMAKYRIPGVAVGVVSNGQSFVFNYGVASTQAALPVTQHTLFELGSVSKTFTATLASCAQLDGKLALTDTVGQHLPALQGAPFGDVTLLELGTHTPGGLPVQVPDEIHDNTQLLAYFKTWKPTYAPGSYRTYSNPGIGSFGLITAKSLGQPFAASVEQRLFAPLGMKDTYFDVPPEHMTDYAQGYRKDGTPVRVSPGVLATEAYGIKSTAADMNRFVQANMHLLALNDSLQRAITQTHTAYFTSGALTQDLIWEQYPYPVALKNLQDGNAPAMLNATPATAITPPLAPRDDVWINKTGSTNGFGTYVAFIPAKHLGIVILANRNIPNEDRVNAAYRILSALANRSH